MPSNDFRPRVGGRCFSPPAQLRRESSIVNPSNHQITKSPNPHITKFDKIALSAGGIPQHGIEKRPLEPDPPGHAARASAGSRRSLWAEADPVNTGEGSAVPPPPVAFLELRRCPSLPPPFRTRARCTSMVLAA